MLTTRRTIGERLARAARAHELRRTSWGRPWLAVFLNEKTVTLTLHGRLSAEERILARCPDGRALVREFHQQLFRHDNAALLRRITRIAGMDVRGVTAEVDEMTGTVVQVFTTWTVADGFLFAPRTRAGPRPVEYGLPRRHTLAAGRPPRNTRMHYPG